MADPLDNILDDDENAGLPGGDDDLSNTLRAEFDKIETTDQDDEGEGGFELPLDDDDIPARETVSEEDGIQKVRDSKDGTKVEIDVKTDEPAPQDAKPAPATAKAADTPPVQADAKGADDTGSEGEDPKSNAQPVAADDAVYQTALDAMTPEVRARYDAQIGDAAGINKIFDSRKDELTRFGVSATEAVENLANINDYAVRDPEGYVNWFVGQVTGSDPTKQETMLKNVLGKLGYNIEKAAPDEDDDDDPFMSDGEKDVRRELAELKSAQAPQQELTGPNSDREVATRTINEVAKELGADGQPLRPHWQRFVNSITANVRDIQAQGGGRKMTREDLVTAYDSATLSDPVLRQEFIDRQVAQTLAAQGGGSVPDVVKNNAASVRKAKASTQLLDGPGQSAPRRPAGKPDDLSIDALLNNAWKD